MRIPPPPPPRPRPRYAKKNKHIILAKISVSVNNNNPQFLSYLEGGLNRPKTLAPTKTATNSYPVGRLASHLRPALHVSLHKKIVFFFSNKKKWSQKYIRCFLPDDRIPCSGHKERGGGGKNMAKQRVKFPCFLFLFRRSRHSGKRFSQKEVYLKAAIVARVWFVYQKRLPLRYTPKRLPLRSLHTSVSFETPSPLPYPLVSLFTLCLVSLFCAALRLFVYLTPLFCFCCASFIC